MPLHSTSYFVLRGALPILGHLGGVGRIDLTPRFSVLFSGGTVGLFDAPLTVSFNLGDYVFLGAWSGFGCQIDDAERTAYVPLGAFLGGTIPGESGPITDIRASFSFPGFYSAAHGRDPLIDVWQVSLDARFYIYLL